jgi:hypothetical protein
VRSLFCALLRLSVTVCLPILKDLVSGPDGQEEGGTPSRKASSCPASLALSSCSSGKRALPSPRDAKMGSSTHRNAIYKKNGPRQPVSQPVFCHQRMRLCFHGGSPVGGHRHLVIDAANEWNLCLPYLLIREGCQEILIGLSTGEGAAAFVGLTCASALFLGRWKDSDSLTLHALSHILQIDSVRNGVIPSATLAEPETRLRTLTLLKTSMPEVWHCFKLHKH